MNQEHDLFERFPDGSSLWRDSIRGPKKTRIRLHELARRSENEFYAINLETGEILAVNSERNAHVFRAPSITKIRGESQSA